MRIAIAPPIVWRSISRIVSITRLTGTGAIRIRWMREKASNWVVSLAPRRPDSSAASAIRLSRGSSTPRARISSPPITGVSRLLKSCAMPPVSWPTASIFCAWRKRLLGPLALADLGLQPVERGAQIGGARRDPRLQQLLGQLPVGDVVGDADEADMLAARAPARLRDRAQPAPLAVAAAEAPLQHERLQRRLAGERFGDGCAAHRRDG